MYSEDRILSALILFVSMFYYRSALLRWFLFLPIKTQLTSTVHNPFLNLRYQSEFFCEWKFSKISIEWRNKFWFNEFLTQNVCARNWKWLNSSTTKMMRPKGRVSYIVSQPLLFWCNYEDICRIYATLMHIFRNVSELNAVKTSIQAAIFEFMLILKWIGKFKDRLFFDAGTSQFFLFNLIKTFIWW